MICLIKTIGAYQQQVCAVWVGCTCEQMLSLVPLVGCHVVYNKSVFGKVDRGLENL